MNIKSYFLFLTLFTYIISMEQWLTPERKKKLRSLFFNDVKALDILLHEKINPNLQYSSVVPLLHALCYVNNESEIHIRKRRIPILARLIMVGADIHADALHPFLLFKEPVKIGMVKPLNFAFFSA